MPNVARIALPGAAALLLGLSALVRIGDSDVFGHVAVGELVLASGALPTRDPFSYASGGRFEYTEAFVQALYALVVRAGGFPGLVAFNALLLVGVGALAARLAEGRPAVKAAIIGLLGLAIFPATTLKPQVFSYLAFGVTLLVLRAAESGRLRILAALPALFFAWGLSHRAGVLGVAVVGGSALLAMATPTRRTDAPRWFLVAALSAVAFTAHPYGLFVLRSSVDVLARSSFRETLAEWQPLTLTGLLRDHPGMVALAALAVWERARTRRHADVELIALIATTLLASRAGRLLPFLALACMAPASRALEAATVATLLRLRDAVRPALAGGLLVVASCGAFVDYVVDRVPAGMFGLGIEPAFVPVGLARAVSRATFRGELFHAFDFGGYFLYALRGQHRVLVDGRNDTVYSDAHFRSVLAAEASADRFRSLDARYDFGAAAFRWRGPTSYGGAFLAGNPDWALVHWDDLGTLLVRRDHGDPLQLADIEYLELHPRSAFQRAARPTADAADARFYAEVLRNAEDCPDSARAAYVAALAAKTRGRAEDHARHRARLVELVEARGLQLPIP